MLFEDRAREQESRKVTRRALQELLHYMSLGSTREIFTILGSEYVFWTHFQLSLCEFAGLVYVRVCVSHRRCVYSIPMNF